MPTINEVIRRVDQQRPNALTDAQKSRWLLDLDGRIYRETTAADAPDTRPPESAAELDKPLLVEEAYANLYDLYLMAMIEYSQGEYAAYNNTALMYDQAMKEWRGYYRRTHLPKARYITGL